MATIFLDMRSEGEFSNDSIEGVINIPLSDIVLDHKLGVIEYYHPFFGNIEELFVNILNQNGYMNLNNLGNVVFPAIIYEHRSTPTIQFMERKEKTITA